MDSIICDVVPSIRGENKLVIEGHLMVKDRSRNNTYYWYCEKRFTLFCGARAVTKFDRAISNIKERTHQTYDKPARIIQDTTSSILQEVHSCLLSRGALQQTIQRIRHSDLPAEPQFLDDLDEFQNILCKGCHFHLAQNVYRRVQTVGLTTRYSTDENFSLLIRQLPALAFLPSNEIPQAFNQLKNIMPIEAIGPLFPPDLWSVVDNIESHIPRTSNPVEAWHRRWNTLLGNTHLGVFRMIKEIQKEQNQVQLDIESVIRGAPHPPQRRHNREHEARIQRI
ncbi:9887_t:CDS:2 [Scutellospora calospora]|uniref:9887_t:CDS:1 n=1 Tax=Scutellospora calospora TaxID=85575 RepID=A0ACA9KEH1_9GLOM|nr:9887_t:CDS:2 [Scutellospora calospora]